MEPDIIRMYSSSPPPLDNGADDDDDDEDQFGEFGEFTEVESSCVGFAEFDAPSYPNSKDGFIPPNLFMPIHDYSDVNSFSCTKTDQDCFAEFSGSTVGQSDLLETITCNEIKQSRTSNSPCDDRTSPSCIIKAVQQKESFVKEERISPETISSEGKNQDLQISSCNGDQVSGLEILTNGFAVLDSVNPQGIENLDIGSHSKGLKSVHALSTKLSLNSIHKPGELDTFSNKSTALQESDHKAHTQLSDGGLPKNQDNNVINRVDPHSAAEHVANSRIDENKDGSELEPVQVHLFEDYASCQQREDICEPSPLSLECSSTLPSSSKSIEHRWGSDEDGNEGRANVHIDASRTDYSTVTVNGSPETTNETDSLDQKKPISSVHTEMVSLDDLSVVSAEHDKDFTTLPVTFEGYVDPVIHAVPPFFGDTETLTGMSLEGGKDGDFRNFNVDSHSEFSAFDTSPKQTLSTFSDPPKTENQFCDLPFDDMGKEDNGEFSEFGDFDSVPKTQEKSDAFQDFDDFADFSSASCNQVAEWSAFDAEQKGSTWATFDEEPPVDSVDNQEEPWQPHRTEMPITSDSDQASKGTVMSTPHKLESAVHGPESAAAFQTSLIGRLERLFQICFPSVEVPTGGETVTTLKVLLERGEKVTENEATAEESLEDSGKQLDVWMKLQNIHDGYGLRYQWGGSHSNKMLLRSLGIDTRNILFTGNKKQPVIVPMYASGLGMLEPTKEPLKPVSAAEKITSIGHTPPVSPEIAPSDQLQESLPPVQFDWSSSGLTNPLDASGGATLLNLDFFGPVDDSSCSSTTTIPGVDPELYELTTSKLESSNKSSKVTDAFAKLMSTVEKTSTSTRKPKKEEHLSEEAAKVIASLPDLSFMHAKVLMFPTTLTPSTGGQEKVD